MKDWKFNERPYCSARSAYGFLSLVGFGCDTSIFLIFKALLFFVCSTIPYFRAIFTISKIGAISRAQRYKNIYKIKTLFSNNIRIHLKILTISKNSITPIVISFRVVCHSGRTKNSDKMRGEVNTPNDILESHKLIELTLAICWLLNVHPK